MVKASENKLPPTQSPLVSSKYRENCANLSFSSVINVGKC